MVIETSRLMIRDLVYDDWVAVHEYASDPIATKYMIWGPNTEDDTRIYVNQHIKSQHSTPRTDYEFAVVLKNTN